MNTFNLSILAADKSFYCGECEYISLPTLNGEIGILANHCNLIAAITAGVLKYRVAGNEVVASVSEGIVKVENGEVLVLVDTIEKAEDIDEALARRRIEELNEELQQKQSIRDYYVSKAKLARSLARLKAKSYSSKNS